MEKNIFDYVTDFISDKVISETRPEEKKTEPATQEEYELDTPLVRVENPWERHIIEAYYRMIPEGIFDFDLKFNFSGQFSDYNGNVRKKGRQLEFRFSRKWLKVDEEIFIGLVQELLLKILPKNETRGINNTMNIDLYNNFVKSLHISQPKNKSHPVLLESFDRVNEKYFNNFIEKPNLIWGKEQTSTLGTYDYKTDTLMVSKVFEEHDDVIDYIMFHELLHKKHKFHSSGRKNFHHTGNFKREEHTFEDLNIINRKIKTILLNHKQEKRRKKGGLFFLRS